MKTTIKTYNGTEGNFYIQAKGLHAGRPLKNAIPNCFTVNTKVKNAYEIVYSLWIAKSFYRFIGGSVIPFIRITDIKKIVLPMLNKSESINTNNFEKINKIDAAILNMEKQLVLLNEMKKTIALQSIKITK